MLTSYSRQNHISEFCLQVRKPRGSLPEDPYLAARSLRLLLR